MTEHHQIVQFVCFETSLPRQVFLSRWEPFAASFLARGIERVVLGEGDGAVGFGFVSRNIWPEARFRAVFPGNLPPDAGGGAVTAVQAGGFRVVASAGMDLLGARNGAVKNLVLVRCQEEALGTIVPMLGHLATQHDQGIGWATYSADPATRGGRFNAALEVYCDVESAARVRGVIGASLPRSSLIEEPAPDSARGARAPVRRGVAKAESRRTGPHANTDHPRVRHGTRRWSASTATSARCGSGQVCCLKNKNDGSRSTMECAPSAMCAVGASGFTGPLCDASPHYEPYGFGAARRPARRPGLRRAFTCTDERGAR
jgi:hypothetical protein